MKNNSLFLSFFAVLAFIGLSFTGPKESEPVVYNINTSASVIKWKGYKVTGQHDGIVRVKTGSLNFQDGQLTGGSFQIDMATITVEDLQGEYAKKLEGHLKSADFFGVDKYPTANFVITNVVSRGKPGEYRITGDLTIKETTKSIKFNAVVKEEGGSQVATADITIDRSEYDVRYGSGSFFDNLGDKTIYDEFDLSVEIAANVQ